MGLRDEFVESFFPTLKRGANQLCAYGAFVRTLLMQSTIKAALILPLHAGVKTHASFRMEFFFGAKALIDSIAVNVRDESRAYRTDELFRSL